jgi:hypothetical protein
MRRRCRRSLEGGWPGRRRPPQAALEDVNGRHDLWVFRSTIRPQSRADRATRCDHLTWSQTAVAAPHRKLMTGTSTSKSTTPPGRMAIGPG